MSQNPEARRTKPYLGLLPTDHTNYSDLPKLKVQLKHRLVPDPFLYVHRRIAELATKDPLVLSMKNLVCGLQGGNFVHETALP